MAGGDAIAALEQDSVQFVRGQVWHAAYEPLEELWSMRLAADHQPGLETCVHAALVGHEGPYATATGSRYFAGWVCLSTDVPWMWGFVSLF